MLVQKQGNLVRESKLSGISPSSWYVSKLHLTHAELGDGVCGCRTRQMMKLTGFKSAILDRHNSTRARVTHCIALVNDVDVEYKLASVCRAITAAKSVAGEIERDGQDDNQLSGFLASFARLNSSPRKPACKSTTRQSGFLPVFEADGSHIKRPGYNDMCFNLVGKDGDKKNIPVAIAFAPKETRSSWAWFFASCIAAVQTWSPASSAARFLAVWCRNQPDVLFWHIALNIADRFKSIDPNIGRSSAFVYQLQASLSRFEHEAVLQDISEAFSTHLHHGADPKESVASCPRKIHPISWTVLGDCAMTDAEIAYNNVNWSSQNAHGSPQPMISCRATSEVKGENNAYLWHHIRDLRPPEVILAFCERVALVTSTQ
ncbi:hypothetical protein PybrP1_005392 [[Pythium] brassicae (nom. inval.)]|nr:hypothetical protein PybrP1_005392 [[Pythium] brassicae (nom. inval.)]